MPGENFVLLVDVARVNFKVNPFLHGSARWADLSDIKAAGLLNNDGVYVGAWRDKGGKIHYLRHAGLEHVPVLRPNSKREGSLPHCGVVLTKGENKVRQARRVELHPTAFVLLERVRGGSGRRLFAQRHFMYDQTTGAERRQASKGLDSG